jgi:hypothetical protein
MATAIPDRLIILIPPLCLKAVDLVKPKD